MNLRHSLLTVSIAIVGCTSAVKSAADIPAQDETGTYVTIPDATVKGIVLLDLSSRNNDEDDKSRNLYSANHILNIAGVPYAMTEDIDSATDAASVIVLSDEIAKKTFSTDEINRLTGWVNRGGVIVAPKIKETAGSDIFNLFGIENVTDSRENWKITWIEPEKNRELAYFDEEEEMTYVIGRENGAQRIVSASYNIGAAEPIAVYQDGKAAVTRNTLGHGKTYSFGVEWRDVVQRSHLNKDFDSQRLTSNAFEPSGDIYPLFIRALYVADNPVAAWKFTVPEGYESVIIPTHDCDSRTAFEEMKSMASYEKKANVNAQYFITTHYFRDPGYMSAFYNNETVKEIKSLLNMGHTVGSHSIGHFPDFGNEQRFPLTEASRSDYFPTRNISGTDGHSDITIGGSTWAEVVLSKNILDEDLGTDVKSFRPGHLVVNSLLPEALKAGNYLYSSSYNAADVLTQFPFPQRIGNEWEGDLSGILEIPLHFSDVFKNPTMDETNWESKVDTWIEVFNKLKGNYAPAVILIHPNKDWKTLAEKKLVENYDSKNVGLYNFEDYGRFWNNRSDFKFTLSYDPENQHALIIAAEEDIIRNPGLGVMLESEEPLKRINLIDTKGKVWPANLKSLGKNRFVVVINSDKQPNKA